MFRLNFYLALIESEEDQNKFECLYEYYKGQMKFYAIKLLQDEYLAEEALQMVFLYVAKNMHKINEPISIETQRLLFLVSRHCSYDIIKRERYHTGNNVTLDEITELATEDAFLDFDSDLMNALRKLSDEYQTVILLRHGMNYKTREIAAILDCTVSKVEKLLSRGKDKLNAALAEVQRW